MNKSRDEIYVLDADISVRDCLSTVMSAGGFLVTSFADDTSLMAAATRRQPCCVVVDVLTGNGAGFELLRTFRKHGYPAPVLAIAAEPSIKIAVAAIQLGAFDFVGKPIDFDQLAIKIRDAIKTDFPRHRFSITLQKPHISLTEREEEILESLVLGHSNKAIAKKTGLSVRTVEFHRGNIMRKYNVKTFVRLLLQVS